MLRDRIEDQANFSRQQLLMDIQRNHLYWKGEHYPVPKLDNGRIRLSSGAVTSYLGGGDQQEVQDYVLNFIYGEGLKLVGILGRIPNCTAVADSKDNSATKRSRSADSIIRALWPHLQLESLQTDLVWGHWISGTQYAYTPFIVDRDEYGVTKVPQFEQREEQVYPAHYECWNCKAVSWESEVAAGGGWCPACKSPLETEDLRPPGTEMMDVEVEPLEFDNGSVDLCLYSGLYVTHPHKVKNLRATPWLILEYEEDSSVLLSTYPELVERIAEFFGATSGQSVTGIHTDQGRHARATVNSYRNYSDAGWKNSEWLYTRVWITPKMYPAAVENLGREAMSKNAANLKEQYPRGLKLTYINGKLLRMEHEKLTDVWAACKPTVSETLMAQALCAPYIKLNDIINDTYCIAVQLAQKGLPLNLFDPEVLHPDFFKRTKAGVMDWIPAMAGTGGRLKDAVAHTEAAKLDPAVMAVASTARASGQEIVGITGALTGMDTRDKTLGEAEMNRNQALLPHNTQWTYIRQFWSDVLMNCIGQLSRYSAGKLFFRAHSQMPAATLEVPNAEDLLNGGYHVECDQAIPMTWGQRRAQVFQVIERGAEVMQMLGYNLPSNLKSIYEVLGNEDFEVPGMALHAKVLDDIELLLSQEPIVGPMGEDLPSIPPDGFEMDHMGWVESFKIWFLEEGHKLKDSLNPSPGYRNVLARAMAELNIVNQLMAASQPQEAPPDGKGAPGAREPQSTSNSFAAPPPPGSPELGPAEQPEEMAAAGLEGV